jgi:hypothetical protein
LQENGENPAQQTERQPETVFRAAPPQYAASDLDSELRQSEIITNLSQFVYDPESKTAIEDRYTHIIVLTQDCDLLRDFEAARGGKPLILSGVLIYPLEPAEDAKPRMRGISWQPITQNNNER